VAGAPILTFYPSFASFPSAAAVSLTAQCLAHRHRARSIGDHASGCSRQNGMLRSRSIAVERAFLGLTWRSFWCGDGRSWGDAGAARPSPRQRASGPLDSLLLPRFLAVRNVPYPKRRNRARPPREDFVRSEVSPARNEPFSFPPTGRVQRNSVSLAGCRGRAPERHPFVAVVRTGRTRWR